MIPPRPTELSHMILRDAIREGDIVIDATAGNGHDTVFLASCVGPQGRVLAFDLQEAAIQSAKTNVTAAGFAGRVEFFQTSHEHLASHAPHQSVAVIMFNLGYLPGENHAVTTQASRTLTALMAASSLLKPGGVLSVVCYPGHAEGAVEAERVEAWMNSLSTDGWRIAKYAMLGTRRPAPFLILVSKP